MAARRRSRDRARPPCAAGHDLRVQREHHGRDLPRGVGVRGAPADGAGVADLAVGDVVERLAQQRDSVGHERRILCLRLTHGGPDLDVAVGAPDPGQIRRAGDVDQPRRRRQAQVHHRHQALPAAQDRDFVAVFGEPRDGIGRRRGALVGERGRLHDGRPQRVTTVYLSP